MFHSATDFNGNISSWVTSSAETFEAMFNDAPAFNQNISSWDITGVATMTNMFNGSNLLSTANYDALLIGWEGQTEVADVPFHAADATHTPATSTAATAKAALEANGWTITDGT